MEVPIYRRRRQHGRSFYTTALLICLFASYSLLRSLGPEDHEKNARLALRALKTEDLQCRLVHHAQDKCQFVQLNCPDEEAGLISYLRFYYCDLANAKPAAFTVLVLWISLLFSTIGIAASDFLCINLSTIASILGMSESLTGVTFLAFGNGSPDVFSTFAAMGSNSGSLAVGELMGAAGFITAVVAGSMALVKPFQVARRSFIRDVGFFVVAAGFSLSFLADGRLLLWECVAMIGFYIFYVAFVVTWHWWMTRRRKLKSAETAARLQHHIPNTQELEVPEMDNEDEESRPANERTELIRGQSGDSAVTLRTPGTPAWKIEQVDDDDEVRDRYLAELQSNMRVGRRGERRNTMTPIRPSLIGALEFRSVLSSLEKRSTNAQPIGLRRYSEDTSHFFNPASEDANTASQHEFPIYHTDSSDPHGNARTGRNRAVSANDAAGLKLDTDLLTLPDTSDEIAVQSATSRSTSTGRHPVTAEIMRNAETIPKPPSPKLFISPSGPSQSPDNINQSSEPSPSPYFLAPPGTVFSQPDYDEGQRNQSRSPALSPRASTTLQVPILHSPHPDHSKSRLDHSFSPYVDSPTALSPAHSRAPSIRLPEPTLSPESTHGLPLLPPAADDAEIRTFRWWPYEYLPAPQIIAATLFPTLYGWRDRSIIDKMLGLVTAPSVFCLAITLPVVEPTEPDDIPGPGPGPSTPNGTVTRSNTQTTLPPDSPSIAAKTSSANGTQHPHGGLSRQVSDHVKTPRTEVEEDTGPRDWNRWLVVLQLFTAPLFIVTIVWANMEEDAGWKVYLRLVLGSLIFSLICLLILLARTTADREPKYRPMLCFLGFLVAIAWISTIADEVVGVLKAFGVILNMSDAILGLTIFAVGNSLGDLVADITVARLGYPVMALSACFGGPMLNILLGIGISGLYNMIKRGAHKHEKHPDRPIRYKPYEIEVSTTLIISGVTLLVTLLGLLVVVPLNGWRMDRRIGWGLIILWCLSTIGNVIVEILGYGGELEI